MTTTPLRVGALLALAAICGVAGSEAGERDRDRDPAESEVTVMPRAGVGLGGGYGSPLGAAATLELMYGLGADVREDSDRVKALAGVMFQLHAGTTGGKLSLGLGARAHVRSEDVHLPAGAGLKLSLAQTWRSPQGDPGRRTYLGPELEFSVMHVNVGLGVLARLKGSTGGRVLFSWDLGARF
jgi:hypothetical protein